MSELGLTIDHLTLSVSDIGRAKSFYTAALAPIDLHPIADVTAEMTGSVAYSGFGRSRKGTLWLAEKGQQTPPTHIAFRAPTREAVRQFHRAALAAGGADNGVPGIREEYHPEYYGAFVLDPEGHNIEAVCFELEAES